MKLDTAVQAEYEDGFILDETELDDISPYNPQENVFRAILEKHPEIDHGKMVRFSVFYKDQRYDYDFSTLPNNARPIRFRHGASYLGIDGVEGSEWIGMQIGFQYNDETGKNHQFKQDLE